MTKKKEYAYVPREKIIVAWQESESAGEVARKLGLDIKAVYWRIAYLRKKGIALKKFKRSAPTGPHIDVKALNALAKKHER